MAALSQQQRAVSDPGQTGAGKNGLAHASPLQFAAEGGSDSPGLMATADTADAKPFRPAGNKTGMPAQLKAGVESLSGMDLSDVRVFYNSSEPAQLQAHAFAQGSNIHIAPGQEQHLAHEAWHVVQQKQGRVKPTTQLKGTVAVNDDAGLEHEADVMGAKAMQFKQTGNTGAPVSTGPDAFQRVVQRMRHSAVDPFRFGDAVDKRKGIGTSRMCVGTARIKQQGAWSQPFTTTSAGEKGPQKHAERMALEHFVHGMIDTKQHDKPFAKQVNVDEGKAAGDLLRAANVTEIDVYTELPPCWGCDPWLTEIDAKIGGGVHSSNSLLLENYYSDYDTLKGINHNQHQGLNLLFDYHIYYVLGRVDIATDIYKMLAGKAYFPPKIAFKGSDELMLNKEALSDIIYRNYEDVKLMGMEVNATNLYYDWIQELVTRLERTSPLFILNNFNFVKQKVEADERDYYARVKYHYEAVNAEMDGGYEADDESEADDDGYESDENPEPQLEEVD